MNVHLNPHSFRLQTLSSASLVQLCCLAHRLDDEGTYIGSVHLKKRRVGSFKVVVSGHSTADDSQMSIDLAQTALTLGAPTRISATISLGRPAYLLFYVSSGSGGYHVTLEKAEQNERTLVYDSRSLASNDLFTATFLKPGKHSVLTAPGGLTGTIQVVLPKASDEPAVLDEPVTIEVTDTALKPAKVKIKPGETVVFAVSSDRGTGISIDLEATSTAVVQPAPTPRGRTLRPR
ncbi:MAG: hypothetical protein KKE73_08895 [Proteobacteria bacterium]|nr:hypothetical protein [Pseudomonadota bacterium]